jgi:hypothetical protein
MKLRIIGVHGINSPEGANSMRFFMPGIQKQIPYADCSTFEYGFMGFWQARWRNHDVAARLTRVSAPDGDEPEFLVWITHSNGAAVGFLAVDDYGAAPDMIVQINPALDRWLTPNVPWVEVIYSEQDRVVDLAQWVPFHIWGDQGKVGYRGRRKNTISHNAGSFGPEMAYEGHLGLFDPVHKYLWQAFIAARIEQQFKLIRDYRAAE